MTPLGIESWILHEILIEPLDLRELYAIAKTKGLSATLDEIVCAVHMMVDEDLVHIEGTKITPTQIPYAELRIDIKDTQVVLREAIRRGGFTIRQVNRCETLLRAINAFFYSETLEADE